MKKYILFVGLGLLLISCKKTWQCECREVMNYQDWNPIVTNVAFEKEKEKDAEVKCKSLSYDFGNGNYKTCAIK